MFEMVVGQRFVYSTTSSSDASSVSRLCILARSESMTLTARGSRSVVMKELKAALASAAALGASREWDGIPPAFLFTGPAVPLLYTVKAGKHSKQL